MNRSWACWTVARLVAFSVAVMIPFSAEAEDKAAGQLPALPQALASFGAAATDTAIYVYGGHIGEAHAHSTKNQTGAFLRLDHSKPERWETLPAGTPLQGLPLVAYQGQIYRIGGMSAKNEPEAEDEDLYSLAEVARFDVKDGKWHDFPALPAGRSSHDAVVCGDQLFVAGGWQLRGKSDDAKWHTDVLVLNLAAAEPKWEVFAEQPFQRRALSIACAPGKLYVVGGINTDGKLSRDVDVLELATKTWSKGPTIPGEDRNGFGIAAFGSAEGLVISGMNGTVYRLSADGAAWDATAKLESPRFFHRVLPLGPNRYVAVGGASFKQGHITALETFALTQSAP